MKKLWLLFAVVAAAALICFCSCESEAPAPATHVHNFGEWTEIKEADCVSDGLRNRYCSCGEIQSEIVPAKGHRAAADPPVAATCTSSGLSEGIHCEICGAVIKAAEPVSPLPHTVVINPAVPATCTAGGSTEWSHCSVCGTVISAPVQLPALGHSMVNGKCTRCGYTESVIVTVDSVEALRAIANDMSGTYYLTTDIDLSGTHWIPLGSASAPFTGTFNGGGHTIRFGMITLTSENGLFHTNDGTVSNLSIIARGASFLNESYCGGYIAVVNNGIIEKCEISGSRTYDFKVERTVAGTSPQKGENQKGVAEDFTANYSFGEICWKNNGSIISCENKGTVTIAHNVYGAQWGHGYGLDILIPYFTSESADHLYVNSDVTFGGVCVENNNTVQGCTLDASYGYTEKIATATQESAWWYANSRAYVCVKAGSVCGVNNGTLKDIRAGMLQLDSCEITKRTESSHESTSFEFVKTPDYTGLLAENKGECVNVAYK